MTMLADDGTTTTTTTTTTAAAYGSYTLTVPLPAAELAQHPRTAYKALRVVLRAQRQGRGWSIPALARRMHMRPPTVGAWERGDRMPSVPDFIAWVNTLGLDVELVPLGHRAGFDAAQVARLCETVAAAYAEAAALLAHDVPAGDDEPDADDEPADGDDAAAA